MGEENTITITTNDRFDRLTNLDISTHYRDKEYWLMRSDFNGAFACWVVKQSPYDTPDITSALNAWDAYVQTKIPDSQMPVKFTYQELNDFITEGTLGSIPEIEILNHRKNGNESPIGFCSRYDQPTPDDDFIDLGALAKNIFYMILREAITHG
jgi:hypothetical protein